jgi:VanZ family protein
MLYYFKKYPQSVAVIIVIWVLCMIPVPETPLNEINFIDKWTHFAMYGALTLVIWHEYRKRHTMTNWCRLIFGGVLCPIVMGVLVEVAQAYLTTCRSGDWFDAVCNTLGVLLGTGIAKLMIVRR